MCIQTSAAKATAHAACRNWGANCSKRRAPSACSSTNRTRVPNASSSATATNCAIATTRSFYARKKVNRTKRRPRLPAKFRSTYDPTTDPTAVSPPVHADDHHARRGRLSLFSVSASVRATRSAVSVARLVDGRADLAHHRARARRQRAHHDLRDFDLSDDAALRRRGCDPARGGRRPLLVALD